MNPLCRAARTREGLDVVIRVIVHGNAGQDHLKILRKIAAGKDSLNSNNHTLPLFREFQFEDIVFGIFPKVGAGVSDVYGGWAKNSVGDIIEMLMQMLEGLAFIHQENVAHRDAFRDNFLVQWHPESLATKKISVSRPRVYLRDFEVAIEFPPECPVDERVCTGLPISGSLRLEKYSRPHAPEFASGKPYNPFKLDVWQLGTSFSELQFKTTIPSIDQVLIDMTHADPVHRLDAQEAFDQLRTVVHSMTPESLLIEPYVAKI
ncbi:kinase-like domain-containing protein [Flammula alnicola]|nr:kinase-like domain-containing protein [Flammula alnicola]